MPRLSAILCLLAIASIVSLPADEPASKVETSAPLTLRWADRYLTISGNPDGGNSIPGDAIRIHYLEAYCRGGSTDRDWAETVIPHQTKVISAGRSDAESKEGLIELEDRLADGVIVRHRIEATHDEVRFTIVATNPTDQPSVVQWAQPCVRVDGFVGADREDARSIRPDYVRKSFLMVDGRITRMPTEPWAVNARYEPGQVYVPAGVDRNDVNPRPLSAIVPSSALVGCYSADDSKILGIVWSPCQEVFQGVATCLHSDIRIGGLEPGEEKTIRGRIYLIDADLDQLLSRFRNDFPAE